MTDTSSSTDSKNGFITKAYLQEDDLVVEFHGQTTKSKVDKNDLDYTTKELRDELDKQTENIELKEQIILFISKTWPAILKNNKIQSFEEWKIGLDKRYWIKKDNRRKHAAKILAGALEDSLKKLKIDKKTDSLLILGIPRGGVIVADIIASKLPYNCDFDIVIPRKLTAPHNQEIAIGATMEDGILYLNDDLINDLEIDKEYIEKEKARQLEEIKRRKSLYCSSQKNGYDIQNKIVILVDDGAATGATLIAAVRWIRKQNPKKLVIAIPVTSKDTIEMLKQECDLVVTGTTPSSSVFKTVGQYYQEFKPVEDQEVIKICNRRGLFST